MPIIYKQDCKYCGEYYEGYGKSFCSRLCSDNAYGKKIIGENNPSWKGGLKEKICIVCNKRFNVYPYQVKNAKYCSRKCHNESMKKSIPWNKDKIGVYSKKSIKKMSESRIGKSPWNKNKPHFKISGKKHWNWKGGISPIYDIIRKCFKYRKWRELVYKRDNYTCQECGQFGGNLCVHHIKSFAFFPELKYEQDNCITLCNECHKNTDNYLGKAKMMVFHIMEQVT